MTVRLYPQLGTENVPLDVVVVDVEPVEAVAVVAPPVGREKYGGVCPGRALLRPGSHEGPHPPVQQVLLPHHHLALLGPHLVLLSVGDVDSPPDSSRARHHQEYNGEVVVCM